MRLNFMSFLVVILFMVGMFLVLSPYMKIHPEYSVLIKIGIGSLALCLKLALDYKENK